ncbi:MAG: Holliday junction resolvase-like protein [Candidatus Aenigmatarchaeota archaeon]
MNYIVILLSFVASAFFLYVLYLRWKLRHEVEKRVEEREDEIRRDALERSRSTLKGKISEHLAPFTQEFDYKASDARFLGSPVDYVIFDGISEESEDIKVVLADVKTGQSKLSSVQRKIKEAVEEGKIVWETVKME